MGRYEDLAARRRELEAINRERRTLTERIADLERAIVEHRTAIRNAGTIKVRPGYEQIAEAKHRID